MSHGSVIRETTVPGRCLYEFQGKAEEQYVRCRSCLRRFTQIIENGFVTHACAYDSQVEDIYLVLLSSPARSTRHLDSDSCIGGETGNSTRNPYLRRLTNGQCMVMILV